MNMNPNQKNIVDALGVIANAYSAGTMTSLPKFTKPALVQSANFMQDVLAEEPIVNDILKNLYNVYVGYIITALQMNEFVADGRKVRDLLSPVSTESLNDVFIDTSMMIDQFSGSMEGLLDPVEQARRDDAKAAMDREDAREAARNKREDAKEAERNKREDTKEAIKLAREKQINALSKGATGSYHSDQNKLSIAAGRQIEVKFNVGNGSEPISLLLNVQFNTRIIPTAVMEFILSQDFNRGIYDRWLQYRAGEIRLVRDFVFSVDRLNRRANALKQDKDHALQDILRHQSKGMMKNVLKAANNTHQYNIANSILMLDEETATRQMKALGRSFNNIHDRNNFFNSTYSLFIVLVDRHYSRVTIYTNGIDQSATYSFSEMKSSAASDKMSLTEVMSYLTQNQMPKF